MTLRVIEDGAHAATANMARDEALLQRAEAATLRLYEFRPDAVSLGYFQRRADFADLPPATALVRRLTGGGAIHHEHELTFALALDAAALDRAGARDIDDSYRLLHDAVAAALRACGVPCRRLERGHAQRARPGERWCFAAPGRHDLVDEDSRKLVGSAQRRAAVAGRARVLHHGSIVLRRPRLTPFVAAVEDATDPAAAAATLRGALAASLGAALRLEPTAGALQPAELAVADQLRRQRYADPDFVARR